MHNGFTLLETCITLALFSMLGMFALFMTMDSYRGYASRSERDTIVSLLQRSRSRSMANINQTTWGLCVDAGASQYVVFRGAYVSGATTNESMPMSPNVSVSSSPAAFSCSAGGVVFTQLTATTSAVTVTLTQNSQISTISINHEGAINW